MSSTEFPSETTGLLGGGARSGDDDNASARRRTVVFWTLTLTGLVALAGWNLSEEYFLSPEAVEQRLVQKYEQIAADSMELLDGSDTTNIPLGCEGTVLILRHCEDLGGHVRYEDGTSHCSYLGFQRSIYLATLFGDYHSNATTDDDDVRWPLPSKLFGLWNQDGTNKRQYELLRPLSDKSGLPIQMFEFETAEVELRTSLFDLLQTGQFCNRVAVVAWKHKFIRSLAATLGCDQEKGCPGGNEFAWDDYDFDTVWELQYVYQPEALRAYPQNQSVHRHKDPLIEGWKVFGSVTQEYFDALEFKRDAYGDENRNWMDGHPHRLV